MKTLLGVGLGLLVVSSAASGDTCAPSTFARGVPLHTEYSVEGITVGDLDGNGFDDLIVTTSADVVVTYLSAGDGTFGPETHSPAASTSYPYVATGFWDANGDLDVAYPIYDAVAVELGNGDGTFQVPVFYSGLPNPTGFGAADLTGDGKVDLVVSGAQSLMVLPGNGDGTFSAPLTYGTTFSPQGLAVGDFDGDGNADVAVTLENGIVSIYPGTGAGGLGPPSTIKVGATLSSIVAADLNHDGKLDLGISAGFYAAVLRGNGDGTFRAAIEYPSGFELGQLAAADLDGDGWTDLVALRRPSYYNGAGIVVPMLQQANGSLKLYPAFVAGNGSQSLAVAQIDGDSFPDVLTADSTSATVSILYGQGGGRLRAPVYAALQTAPQVLADADFDEDGRPDLVAMSTNYDGPLQMVHVVDGTVTLGPLFDLDSSPQGMAAADFNRDGHMDLAVTTFYGGLRLLLGNGDGTFQPPVQYATGWAARSIVAGDFDGNGYPDVALVDQSAQNQPEIAVFLNDGTGVLAPGAAIATNHQVGVLVAASLDAGSTMDLAATNGDCCGPQFDTVLVMHGNGDGTFQPPVEYPAGPTPTALVAADFNGDDGADLAVADGGANTAAILLRDASGGFQAPILVAVGAQPLGLTAADFDLDGKTDLMTSNPGVSTASLLIGTGDGGFQSPVFYSEPGGTAAIRAVNFGGRGADVAIGSGNDAAIEILQNTHLSVQTLYAHTVLLGGRATFSASASGFGPLSYQWLKDATPLNDGGHVAGAQTPTLTIDPASFSDLGAYSVKVTDSCGTITSNGVSLYVEFADVPSSSPFHGDIIAIAEAGITGGCGGADYCPTSPVRRDQMAAFLLRAEHGAAYTPPSCTSVFADVPCPSAFADWVEQLAAEGVTGGCGGGNYCPDQSVTRAQMAVFLLKTSQGSSYTPPAATGIFGDVPVGSFAADFIEDLYSRGITGGCSLSPLLYCPGTSVLRQQMATFLSRTFLP